MKVTQGTVQVEHVGDVRPNLVVQVEGKEVFVQDYDDRYRQGRKRGWLRQERDRHSPPAEELVLNVERDFPLPADYQTPLRRARVTINARERAHLTAEERGELTRATR